MKTYKVIIKTNWQTHVFLQDATNLDDAIASACEQLDSEERMINAKGQVVMDWGNKGD